MFSDLAEARDALSQLFDPSVLELVMAALVPALVLQPVTEPSGPGLTRIGGTPVMAADLPWPDPASPSDPAAFQKFGDTFAAHARADYPLSFIAQIDLAEVAAIDGGPADLPSQGRLLFFHDLTLGPFEAGDRLTKVIWDQSDPADTVTHPLPAALEQGGRTYAAQIEASFKAAGLEITEDALRSPFHAPLRIAQPRLFQQLTPLYAQEFQQHTKLHDRAFQTGDYDFSDTYDIAPWEGWAAMPEVTMLGLPRPEQDDPRYDAVAVTQFGKQFLTKEDWDAHKDTILAQAKDWRLLLQVDVAGWMQTRAEGQVYFLITTADLKAARFDRVIAVYQQT